MTKDSLASYRGLLKTIGPKIGLRTPIRLKPIARGWYFDHRPGKRAITIHVPPYSAKYTAPTFVHYLGHAKLLEDGWPRIKAEIKITNPELVRSLTKLPTEERRAKIHYWASRSEDSFFDFYVWLFLTRKLGTTWFSRFIAPVAERDIKLTLTFLGAKPKTAHTDVSRYLYCLDWFAALRTQAEIHGLDRKKSLDKQYRDVLHADLLTPRFAKKISTTIPWVRAFYTDIHRRYPTHQALLDDPDGFRRLFLAYYRRVWSGLGVHIAVDWHREIVGTKGE